MSSFLKRKIGVPGAVLLGLGSMLGTGVFVSIGLAAGVAEAAVVPAVLVAGFVALCNGISSAQLAAAHPVSGGTYAYGRRWLNPALGFTAGWMFLCAKSASAATAALGFSGYLLSMLSLQHSVPLVLPALALIAVITLLVRAGIQRGVWVNFIIVGFTLCTLLAFCITAGPRFFVPEHMSLVPRDVLSPSFLHASALLFVAFTGYGRIATLGEEIKNPKKSIPLAILFVVLVTTLLYLTVALTAVGAVGAAEFDRLTRETAAPLEAILEFIGYGGIARLVGLGALVALVGVLLNLLLGLSRVLLAMSREGDMPGLFSKIHEDSPRSAVIGVGVFVALLSLPGRVALSWSFSAFTVLIYYALTNLSALRLAPEDRLYPRFFSWAGLFACLILAFHIDPWIWLAGLTAVGVGLIWHLTATRAKTK